MLSFHSALFHQVSITSLKAAHMSEDGSQVIRNNLSPSPEKKNNSNPIDRWTTKAWQLVLK